MEAADRSELSRALAEGDPAKVRALLDAGADIRYGREHGYGALLDAVHGRDIKTDSRLLDLLRLLADKGAPLSGVSSYQESGLRVLSRVGRFDAVALLLDAGADAAQLGWTPLIKAVALGSAGDVEAALRSRPDLEARDFWKRTAWLVAILSGDVAKARLLQKAGAIADSTGRCGQPPLHYAVHSRQTPMLRWLLESGASVEKTDEFGQTPLMVAAESGQLDMIDALLKAGADPDKQRDHEQTALSDCRDRAAALRLLDAGADPRELSREARRAIVGLPPDEDEGLLKATPKEFASGHRPRFGAANPQEMQEPFWIAMIRSGATAYRAAKSLAGGKNRSPVWCAHRFGQSLTILPDGRVVQIGGEHEDFYDPDFFIYNDVFVHEPDGAVRVYGYPRTVFPPTDFHTATLLGESIYVIGCLGYQKDREPDATPVYRLDLKTFAMERLKPKGDAPGWIYKHRAVKGAPGEIRISGGKRLKNGDAPSGDEQNRDVFVLDTSRMAWRTLRL